MIEAVRTYRAQVNQDGPLTYSITVTREGNLWVAEVHGLPSNVSGVMDYESLAELREDMPSFIADLLDVDAAEVTIDDRH